MERAIQNLINAILILLDSRPIQNAFRLVGDIGRNLFNRKNVGFDLDFVWFLRKCKSFGFLYGQKSNFRQKSKFVQKLNLGKKSIFGQKGKFDNNRNLVKN